MPSIAVVDDDSQIIALIEDILEGEGYDVVCYRDSRTALHQINARALDLVILDVIMPKMNGIELLRSLRQKSDIPVIFLTERIEETEELLGLQTGADDYIHKPFSERALLERVKSVLRRVRPSPERETGNGIIDRGDLRIDKERYTCSWKGRGIVLTLTEFRLLEALVVRIGVVQTRDALKASAYGDEVYVDERTIDSHMKRLRRKFREVDEEFDRIETLYGIGYRFRE
ncbi:MAG: response regulator transcription factor [Hyphomicrobiales bacterium]|nr:response regulator transcription factor [Hyphomicrobiales bacterium]MBV8827519.1 response regulator transcription factor [Hyphomicrobiales bacterium]MBV9428015.1 response regulator transcription factor [Bradyrhizobiaceae bacterium]